MSFDVLDPDFVFDRQLFIEASAGTGKTFTLEHLVLRLIVEHQTPLEEILIVTFTRAATRELKERIAQNLAAALRQIQTGSIEWGYLKPSHASAIECALLSLDTAAIYTIHGFCHRLLSEFSFEAHTAFSVPTEDDPISRGALFYEVRNFLRVGLHEDLIHPVQLKLLLRHFNHDLQRLTQSLLSPLQKEPVRSFGELQREVKAQNGFVSAFLKAAPQYKGFCNRAGDIHEKWLDQAQAVEEGDLKSLLEGPSLFSLLVDENLKKGGEPLPQHLEELKIYFTPLIEEAKNMPRLWALLSKKLNERLSKVKEAYDLFTPDDLLEEVTKALNYPEFFRKAQGIFKGVIIDEFQDTDKTQWHIFNTLFGSLQHFVVVGDPKQSIYSFRGADLSVYYDAKKQFGESQSLLVNYRSAAGLTQALNTLFSKNPQWLIEGSYVPVEAGLGEKEGASLEIIYCEGDLKRERTWPTKRMEEDILFPFIANELQKYPYEDVALLIKDRYQAARLETFLKERRIPTQSKGVQPLKETRVYSLFLDFFRALEELNNLSSLKRFLGHPLMPFSLADLVGGLKELKTPLAHMHALKDVWKKSGVGVLVESLLSTEWKETSCPFFECLPLEDYNDLMQIASLLFEGKDPLKVLQKIGSNAAENEERYKRTARSDGRSVTIMTMHMSKGLEFPVVFALGLASRHRGDEEDKEAAELMRGLYVALTRARHKVYFPIAFERGGKEGNLSASERFFSFHLEELTAESLVQFLRPLQEKAPIHLTPLFPTQAETHTKETASSITEPQDFSRVFTHPLLHSFTSLAKSHEAPPLPAREEGDLPPGTHTGILLHTLFETVIEQNLWHKNRLKPLISHLFPDHVPLVTDMIHATFNLELTEGLTLAKVPVSDMVCELPLNYPLGEELFIKGFADLTFRFEEKYYLLDWKSNLLPSYCEKSLIEAMQSHDYYFQAQLYAEALRRSVKSEAEIGGVIYLFLRGPKAHFFQVDFSRVEEAAFERIRKH